MMRALTLALALALLGAAPAAAATKTVKVGDDFFRSKSITVSKGTTVKWKWIGSRQHNVTVQKGPRHFRSDLKRSGTFKRTLSRRGTYKIICSIHAPDMRMTIKVQ
jgi:plastocyanin